MTPKLTVILCIIRESYAIHGHESTYDIGLLFYDIGRCAVLSACQCDILVNTMDDCNPLAATSSFSCSDNHNVSVCMHEIESLSQHQCQYRRARNNDATPKNPRNNTTRSAACADASDRDDSISNNQSDEEDETNNDSDDSTETTKAQSVRTVNFNGIKIVHCNCQGANGKLAANKDVIQRDCIEILLLQDTRLSRRTVDNLPKLQLHGYSTFDVPKSETSHGMVILVHKDIPSDLAQQFILGPQTKSLSIRI